MDGFCLWVFSCHLNWSHLKFWLVFMVKTQILTIFVVSFCSSRNFYIEYLGMQLSFWTSVSYSLAYRIRWTEEGKLWLVNTSLARRILHYPKINQLIQKELYMKFYYHPPPHPPPKKNAACSIGRFVHREMLVPRAEQVLRKYTCLSIPF